VVASGPFAGASLDDVAAARGAAFIGTAAARPGHFPLLVKLLDPAEWLSVQVHPDDDQARRLEGPDAVGKTEAWYVIEADEGAEILLGVRPGVTPEAVRSAVVGGGLAGLLERWRVAAGQAYLVPAGTLHAVGPCSLILEIQEPSDITYRCDDWGRPASPERPLHTAQSLACIQPVPWPSEVRSIDATGATGAGTLVACDHFVLEGLRPGKGLPIGRDPGGVSVHVLVAVAGGVLVRGNGWAEVLEPLEALVVPAGAGAYEVAADGAGPATVLLGRLPSPQAS
jgi:mannose-6-phosphate isomerase